MWTILTPTVCLKGCMQSVARLSQVGWHRPVPQPGVRPQMAPLPHVAMCTVQTTIFDLSGNGVEVEVGVDFSGPLCLCAFVFGSVCVSCSLFSGCGSLGLWVCVFVVLPGQIDTRVVARAMARGAHRDLSSACCHILRTSWGQQDRGCYLSFEFEPCWVASSPECDCVCVCVA